MNNGIKFVKNLRIAQETFYENESTQLEFSLSEREDIKGGDNKGCGDYILIKTN